MKIALVGGTGDIGTGLALRWAGSHEILIGSRKKEKAVESAGRVLEGLRGKGQVEGLDNGSAIQDSQVVVLCVPYEHLISVTSDLVGRYSGQIVVSPVVPMVFNGKHFDFTPPAEGSAAMQIKALLPEDLRIVSAFHTICAAALQDLERELNADVLVCGDDQESLEVVAGLVKEIKNLRPLNAGPLTVSGMVESLTPMLLNVAKRSKIKDPGIKIVSER
jgi:NADPH-dependent F420 reductase